MSPASSAGPAPRSSSPAAAAAAGGGVQRILEVPSRPLRATVRLTLCSPADAPDDRPLPLLGVHDGPEYASRAGLPEVAAALVAAGRAPAHRLALLDPGAREEWYSASALYARALTGEVLPAVGRVVAVRGTPVALGASLGALALLHAHRRHPGAFAGLLLQSGSYFIPRFDAMERGFARYGRIVRFVRGTLRETAFARPVPAVLTCAAGEDNVHNNRRVAAALRAQGYPATLHETAGGHDFATWGAALEEHLGALLTAAWGPAPAHPRGSP